MFVRTEVEVVSNGVKGSGKQLIDCLLVLVVVVALRIGRVCGGELVVVDDEDEDEDDAAADADDTDDDDDDIYP